MGKKHLYDFRGNALAVNSQRCFYSYALFSLS